MVTSAHVVAEALRARHPGVGAMKLQKLLYYCQGHHLATFGMPLFRETISAWDNGPVVGALWRAEKDGEPPPDDEEGLGEAELNTVGYVLSRYGGLTGRDLIHLTHSEEPWRRADSGRRGGTSAPIAPRWMEEYFRSESSEDEDTVVLDASEVAEWLRDAQERLALPAAGDDLERLAARAEEIRRNPRRAG